KEVGGDFYDMFFLDERHLCMVMADVAGKGIPAALFMVRAMTTIKSRAKEGGTPAEILFDVNNELTEDNKAKIFVTVWLGILDMETGVLTESNAGHENPVVGYEGRPYEYIKTKHGFVLGGRKNMKYRDDSISLEPGGTFFIYTDGVIEATDIKGERFYNDRLLEALNKMAGQKPKDIISHVGEEIRGFVKDAPQFDDMTMLAVRWQGKKKDKLPGGSL
ncbi:MAG: serine/threonine-protein phosphatase, partial [Lachnospiraceae bacterium]|nr:serine/threonine-protein phosphatase [Lachnospiraceae bacterium]